MQMGSTKKIWRLKRCDESKAVEIANSLGIFKNTAVLLCVRGVDSPESARVFLSKASCCFYNPFLLKDMDKAVDRIISAVEKKEKICVYGDYDVDGITATSLLCMYLRQKGLDCDYYIPKRSSEGYGINFPAISQIAKNGASLIISVDTGVTAVEEIEKAKELNIDIIITDHHECKSVLPDTTVVNPCRPDCTYPYKSLAGVGVVFKLTCAVEMALQGKRENMPPELLKELLAKYAQMVALGTVADVMPSTDENRLIISIGLSMMQKNPAPWCSSILDFYGFYNNPKDNKQISTSTIGYIIAPRINAAGRIGDVDVAVKLFLTDSISQASAYAAELCELNRKRQQMENEILEQAEKILKEEPDSPFIILSSDNWNQGIIGIVASRISEKYCRPCILITFCDEDTLSGKGSGRSVKGINIYDALESCKDLLIKYGGHELAAGLTIDRSKLSQFKKRINEYTSKVIAEKSVETVIEIDREPCANEITLEAANELRMLEPFGYGNPSPLFLIRNAVISDICPMGNDKHCKFTLTKDLFTFQSVYFGIAQNQLPFCSSDTVDAIFSMESNSYNGKEKLQLIIKDIMPSAALAEKIKAQTDLYEKIKNGTADNSEVETVIPTRDDFKSVYLYILRLQKLNIDAVNYPLLARKLSNSGNGEISICKFRIILDIFKEKLLIDYRQLDSYTLKLIRSDKIASGQKVNLDGSEILNGLRNYQRRV